MSVGFTDVRPDVRGDKLRFRHRRETRSRLVLAAPDLLGDPRFVFVGSEGSWSRRDVNDCDIIALTST